MACVRKALSRRAASATPSRSPGTQRKRNRRAVEGGEGDDEGGNHTDCEILAIRSDDEDTAGEFSSRVTRRSGRSQRESAMSAANSSPQSLAAGIASGAHQAQRGVATSRSAAPAPAPAPASVSASTVHETGAAIAAGSTVATASQAPDTASAVTVLEEPDRPDDDTLDGLRSVCRCTNKMSLWLCFCHILIILSC